MKRFRELSAQDQQKIRAKIDELASRTGKDIGYDLVAGSTGENSRHSLQVIVNGRCQMQAEIPKGADNVADLICTEIESSVLAFSRNQLTARAAAANH